MKDIFISYRRENKEGQAYGTTIANLIYDKLNDAGYKGRVFLDHKGIINENFEEKILKTIRQAKVFILLLTQDALYRCYNDEDWVRREISEAKKFGLEIIVINYNNEFNNNYPQNFPEELSWLKTYHSQIVRAAEFREDMDKLIAQIINPSLKKKNREDRKARREVRLNRLKGIFSLNKKFWIALSSIIILVSVAIPTINWIKEENVPFSLEDAKTLGDMYYKEGEYDKAIPYLKYAAKKGYAPAQNHLGLCYSVGQGVEQNYKIAVKWLRKAVEQGNAEAQGNLGAFYYEGKGVPQNYTEAMKLYRKAVEQGDGGAQYNLGVCYAEGKCVPKDYAAAVKWWRKAAEQGLPRAQYNLGVSYYYGDGVLRDYKQAIEWCRKAAKQGDVDAQNLLKDHGESW